MEDKSTYQIAPLPGGLSSTLLESVEQYRLDANQQLDSVNKSIMGQYFTNTYVAQFMASLFSDSSNDIHLLDPGAGVGSLATAFIDNVCNRKIHPQNITITAYEMDSLLVEYLHIMLGECDELCQYHDIKLHTQILETDFIQSGVDMLWGGLFPTERFEYDRVILNPPYRKIRSDSHHRHLLRSIGVETSNLYTAFLAIAMKLLKPGGELVAITPRSFCNGSYFKSFRELFFEEMSLKRIHVFAARDQAFKDDDVLQENIIFHAVKSRDRSKVLISTSLGVHFDSVTWNEVNYDKVVDPGDPNFVIHLVASEIDQFVLDRIGVFSHSLEDLGIDVSTGRVVDFRVKSLLRDEPNNETFPLIYPGHFYRNYIRWPKKHSKKPNAIYPSSQSNALLLPRGDYVLVKRFSSKEEERRIVAAVYDGDTFPHPKVGFENHLNVFHRHNNGLPKNLAKGLAFFLNSTLIDSYFRQFNGHTQVNATDLRMLRFPDKDTLLKFGSSFDDEFPNQKEIDSLLEKEILHMTDISSPDPVIAKEKMQEALNILKLIGLPKGQQNERSALALLALLDLIPEKDWKDASSPLIGITPIMDFSREHYGRQYAPNTRETFRRQSIHQFINAGLVLPNPDDPDRAVNSPYYCYQIESSALALLRTYGTSEWHDKLKRYLDSIETLKERYAKVRQLKQIPVRVSEGVEIYLSTGTHSKLIKAIIEEFAPRFAPGGKILYVGDTANKWGYFDSNSFQELGVLVDLHGKMPDVVIFHEEKNWLLLVEAVTSHGPVDPKRREELSSLFVASKLGLVYVTAFLTRKDLSKYISDISWETDVWVHESSSHLIHFDGNRFLGPYET